METMDDFLCDFCYAWDDDLRDTHLGKCCADCWAESGGTNGIFG